MKFEFFRLRFWYHMVWVLWLSSTQVAHGNGSDTAALFSHRWEISEMHSIPVRDSLHAWLEFASESNAVSGIIGCNSFNCAFQYSSSGKMNFGAVSITEKMCFSPQHEASFIQILKKTDRWKLDGTTLKLYQQNQLLAELSGKEKPAMSHEGLNGSWEMHIHSETPVMEEIPWILINVQNGTLTGNSSCNSFNTTFTLDHSKIRLNEIISTRKACPGDTEKEFFRSLSATDNYRFEKDLLEFRQGNETVIRFHRRH